MISKSLCTLNIKRWTLLTAAGYVLVASVYIWHFGPSYLSYYTFPEIFIAPIMAVGSFVAGSTFLGGGAVAFPAMTKILVTSPIVAKHFSLIIQSVGMTSASVLILSRISPFPYRLFLYYLPSVFSGSTLSLFYLDHRVGGEEIKVGFTLFVLCFYCVFLLTRNVEQGKSSTELPEYKGSAVLVVAGFVGGIISGLIGSGADLVLFCVLSFYFKLSLKRATLLSVVCMAATSLYSSAVLMYTGALSEYAVALWVVAAPVVLVGAPIGAWVCLKIKEVHLFWFVSFLVFLEVFTSLLLNTFNLASLKYYIILVACLVVSFQVLFRLSREQRTPFRG